MLIKDRSQADRLRAGGREPDHEQGHKRLQEVYREEDGDGPRSGHHGADNLAAIT